MTESFPSYRHYSSYMRNNLIPTAVTDKNGKQTTVHKRSGVPAPGGKTLAGMKPSLGNASLSPRDRFDDKYVTIEWRESGHRAEPSTGENSFLGRAGLVSDKPEGTPEYNAIRLTQGDLFEFLRLGISQHEAAYLTLRGHTLEELRQDPKFMSALPGGLVPLHADANAGITNVIDYLHDTLEKPAAVAKLLQNGLNDSHFDKAVIEKEQVIELFKRFKYQPSTVGADTNAAVTLDALLEGKLPVELMDKEYERTTLTMAVDAIYPRKKARKDTLNEDERAYLISNPHEIVSTVKAMNQIEDRRGRDFTMTFRSIQQFGYDNTVKYDPNLLLMRPDNGEQLGVEGALRVLKIADDLEWSMDRGSPIEFHRPSATSGYTYNRSTRETRDVEFSDLALMDRAGVSSKEIVEHLSAGGIGSREVLAIIRGDTSAPLVGGWL